MKKTLMPLFCLPIAALGVQTATGTFKGRFREAAPQQIRPEGHLLEFLNRQASGLTGHPEVMGYPFDGCLWEGKLSKTVFSEAVYRPTVTEQPTFDAWWPYEQSAYYLDGILRLSLLIDAPKLRAVYDRNIAYVLAHPDKQGMLGHTLFASDSEWPMAVFFKSVIAYVGATGDRQTIDAFVRHYRAMPAETIAAGMRHITNLEGLLKAYEWSGDETLLKKAVAAYARQDELVSKQSPRDGDLCRSMLKESRLTLHGVTFAEEIKLPVLLYIYTGDRAYLDEARACLNRVIAAHGQPAVGAFSANEFFSGRDPMQGFETCTTSDMIWSLGYFLQADGGIAEADRLEKLAYNALPGAVTPDFCGLQYLSGVNLAASTPFANHSHFGFAENDWRAYAPRHFPQCCGGNVHRAMPNFVLRSWMLDASDGSPVAVLYGPTRFTGKDFSIEEATDYPFEDTVRLRFHSAKPVRTALTFRVPSWCRNATRRLNREAPEALKPGAYARLEREWREGDVLTLELRAPVTFGQDRQWMWVTRGPLAFSYAVPARETRDSDSRFATRSLTPTAPWNYAIDKAALTSAPIALARQTVKYPFEEPALTLTVPVRRITGYDELLGGRLTPPVPLFYQTVGPAETLKLQPYCTTLTRITAFPDAVRREPVPVVAVQVSEKSYPAGAEIKPGYKTVPFQRNADGFCDLAKHFGERGDRQAFLVYRIWGGEKGGPATAALSAGTRCQALFNGREVFASESVHDAQLEAPAWFRLDLAPGYNYLTVRVEHQAKTTQYMGDWGARLDLFR